MNSGDQFTRFAAGVHGPRPNFLACRYHYRGIAGSAHGGDHSRPDATKWKTSFRRSWGSSCAAAPNGRPWKATLPMPWRRQLPVADSLSAASGACGLTRQPAGEPRQTLMGRQKVGVEPSGAMWENVANMRAAGDIPQGPRRFSRTRRAPASITTLFPRLYFPRGRESTILA